MNDLLNESIDEGQPSRVVQIFDMSQDFRMPLHIILGCADMAENHYEDKDLLLRYLKSIRTSGEYLLGQIDKVMDAANQSEAASDRAVSAEKSRGLEDYLKEHVGSQEAPYRSYDFSRKRILVAEDMELNREIAGEILKQTDAAIEFAEDGQICLEKVLASPAGYYDLILMDVMMPNMDGIEATRRIRELPDKKKASIPIIAVSANVYEKDRNAALEAGMDAFTEKPIFIDKLFEVMKQHLQEEN